jgi:hypothetical protein
MGTELLVAGLWVAVLVYWLWTRRPTTGDTVGLFRYELRALRQATPSRVAPANRMTPARPAPAIGMQGLGFVPAPAGRPLSDHLAAAAATHRKMVMRRRRLDVLCALGAAAGILLGLAALTGSTTVVGLQVMADVGLGGYVVMLNRTARAGGAPSGRSYATSAAARRQARPRPGPEAIRGDRSSQRGSAEVPAAAGRWVPGGYIDEHEQQVTPATLGPVRVPGPHLFDQAAYVEQIGRERRGHAYPAPPVAAYARSAGAEGDYPSARDGAVGTEPETPTTLVLTGLPRPAGPVGRSHAPHGAGPTPPAVGVRQVGPDTYRSDDEGVYGDFDSYASLALAN